MKKLPLKTLHSYVFLSFLIFLGMELLRHQQISAPDWVFFYLSDFLVIPIVAWAALRVIWFYKKETDIRLNLFHILSLVVLYSLYFEVYLPKVNLRYTADIWDAICYLLGGFAFWGLQKLP